MTIQVNATEQYFSVVLFITLYKVVLSFVSLDEILTADSSSRVMSSTFSIFCKMFFGIFCFFFVLSWGCTC